MSRQKVKTPRLKISASEFDRQTVASEIKRIGKSLVIINEQGKMSLVSQSRIKGLKSSVLQNADSAIIRTNGLSRAQVGRIVGDLKQGSPAHVFVRRVSTQKANKPRATSFEILLMDGNGNEE